MYPIHSLKLPYFSDIPHVYQNNNNNINNDDDTNNNDNNNNNNNKVNVEWEEKYHEGNEGEIVSFGKLHLIPHFSAMFNIPKEVSYSFSFFLFFYLLIMCHFD